MSKGAARHGVASILATTLLASAAFAQSPSDLQLRLELRQLEIGQWQRERELERSLRLTEDAAERRRLRLEGDLVRQDRDLQIMRFQLDQHRLEQSHTRRALQPQPIPGTLRLP